MARADAGTEEDGRRAGKAGQGKHLWTVVDDHLVAVASYQTQTNKKNTWVVAKKDTWYVAQGSKNPNHMEVTLMPDACARTCKPQPMVSGRTASPERTACQRFAHEAVDSKIASSHSGFSQSMPAWWLSHSPPKSESTGDHLLFLSISLSLYIYIYTYIYIYMFGVKLQGFKKKC